MTDFLTGFCANFELFLFLLKKQNRNNIKKVVKELQASPYSEKYKF